MSDIWCWAGSIQCFLEQNSADDSDETDRPYDQNNELKHPVDLRGTAESGELSVGLSLQTTPFILHSHLTYCYYKNINYSSFKNTYWNTLSTETIWNPTAKVKTPLKGH